MRIFSVLPNGIIFHLCFRPRTSTSQCSITWPAQISGSSTFEGEKSGVTDPNPTAFSIANNTTDETSAHRGTIAEFSAFGKNIDARVEGAASAKAKADKRQRTMSGVQDIGKKFASSGRELHGQLTISNYNYNSKKNIPSLSDVLQMW